MSVCVYAVFECVCVRLCEYRDRDIEEEIQKEGKCVKNIYLCVCVCVGASNRDM